MIFSVQTLNRPPRRERAVPIWQSWKAKSLLFFLALFSLFPLSSNKFPSSSPGEIQIEIGSRSRRPKKGKKGRKKSSLSHSETGLTSAACFLVDFHPKIDVLLKIKLTELISHGSKNCWEEILTGNLRGRARRNSSTKNRCFLRGSDFGQTVCGIESFQQQIGTFPEISNIWTFRSGIIPLNGGLNFATGRSAGRAAAWKSLTASQREACLRQLFTNNMFARSLFRKLEVTLSSVLASSSRDSWPKTEF